MDKPSPTLDRDSRSRRRVLTVVGSTLATLLAGCSTDTGSTDDTPAAASPTSTQTATAPSETTTHSPTASETSTTASVSQDDQEDRVERQFQQNSDDPWVELATPTQQVRLPDNWKQLAKQDAETVDSAYKRAVAVAAEARYDKRGGTPWNGAHEIFFVISGYGTSEKEEPTELGFVPTFSRANGGVYDEARDSFASVTDAAVKQFFQRNIRSVSDASADLPPELLKSV